ncbi:hypothetical protein T190130A13A_30453 [Tenacibaculum sp. 190130A14a]|uniref:Uncharacterized protein n=1 Tax=Tenacibaculum polynesiense TaxID=3137857 RepID=A0ABM9PCP6_9FLAO
MLKKAGISLKKNSWMMKKNKYIRIQIINNKKLSYEKTTISSICCYELFCLYRF